MEKQLEELKSILKNLKKSPGRIYTQNTTREKLRQIENIKENLQIAKETEENKEKVLAINLEFNKIYITIKDILTNNQQIEKLTMAAFNLDTVSKSLPLFTGNFIELESFIVTSELINKTLTDTAKKDFLQYVYYAKLTSNVRTAIGNQTKPENFQELKDLLLQRYKNNKTIPELQNKLNTIYQGKLTVNSYRDKITAIIDNLNELGIRELGQNATQAEKNVITRLNNKLALDTFKKGLNDRFKTTIYAARPMNLQEASDLAVELENEQKSSLDTIMHFRRVPLQSQQRNHFRTNNTFNSNRHNNTFSNRNNRYNTNTSNTNFNRNNTNFNRNTNYNNTTNRNNTNFNRNNNSNNNNRYSNSNNSYPNRNNTFSNNSENRNNFRQNQNNSFRNNNNQIRTIHESGNMQGSEYLHIPDSQN